MSDKPQEKPTEPNQGTGLGCAGFIGAILAPCLGFGAAAMLYRGLCIKQALLLAVVGVVGWALSQVSEKEAPGMGRLGNACAIIGFVIGVFAFSRTWY